MTPVVDLVTCVADRVWAEWHDILLDDTGAILAPAQERFANFCEEGRLHWKERAVFHMAHMATDYKRWYIRQKTELPPYIILARGLTS